jgi:RNA polymerase sigma factor (sigma-70 family)
VCEEATKAKKRAKTLDDWCWNLRLAGSKVWRMPSSASPSPISGGAREFATTHWSLVLAAGGDTSGARVAVARLCSLYWYPLYAFARRMGLGTYDAEDATQGCFAHLLRTDGLSKVAREKGRFRSFLLAALKNHLSHERERATAQKRGGGERVVDLDALEAEARYALEPTDDLSPDRLFDRRWALAVLEQAQERLRSEYDASGKGALFEALRPTLGGARSGPAYSEIAVKLGLSEGAVKVAVHRLRDRYRGVLRSVVADTVATPVDVDAELRHLIAAL